MSEKYYQRYGPVQRRRAEGTLDPDEPPPQRELPPERPRSRYRTPRRKRRSIVTPVLFVLFVAAIAVVLPYAANLYGGHAAVQGVSVQGKAVGGMDQQTIAKQLEQRYAAWSRQPLTLTFEGKQWQPTLAELGVKLDVDQTAAAAVMATREGGPLERMGELWALWRGGVDVSPRLSVDQYTLQAYLTNISRQLEHPPRDAALSVAEGKVIPTAAQAGRQVLVDATAADILHALQSLQPQTVTLRTRALEPMLTDQGMAQAITDARTLLSGPLTLTHGDQSWTWQPDKIAELLSTRAEHGQMIVTVDPDRLHKAVADLAQVVDSGSAEPRLAFNGSSLQIIEPGKTGWQLKQDEAATMISQALRTHQRTLALPVAEVQPQVTPEKLATLGIHELVGEGKTSFAGSAAYRITNIKAGAARMNGVLIAPDEEFSFNTQLGAVDETNGFVEGYAVIGNRTQLEWGGGVCQDSTTVFRAAFWAGLPITERHAHPFYISWYDAYSFPDQAGPGMDATIYTGVQDLKFKNDTGNWLLMEATVDEANQVLTVRLYGTRPNRTVTLRGPTIDNIVQPPASPVYVDDPSLPAGTVKQTDVARRGMDIAVERIITENGVERPPEVFFTRFKAWPNVFVRGTGR
jgi:vancomycin resistance protein YoaR